MIIPLVITSIEEESNLRGIGNIPIDKEIYFLDKKSLKIYEAYHINEIHITRYFGQFDEIGQNFIPAKDMTN